jgi:hypothetical protein
VDNIDRRLKIILDLEADMERRLQGGGGGGISGDMEARVARLESDVANLVKQGDRADARLVAAAADLSTIKTDVAVLKATAATKGFIVSALLASLAVIAGLVAFGEKLQALLR